MSNELLDDGQLDDERLDGLLRHATPVTDRALAALDLAAPLDELCEAIMTTPTTTAPATSTSDHDETIDLLPLDRPTQVPHRRWKFAAALGTAAAVIVALVVIANVRSSPDDSHAAWAAPLVEYAERSPLLLMQDSSWTVVRADHDDQEGEITFTDGQREADLHWRAGPLSVWLDDRLDTGVDLGPYGVVNGTATVVQDVGSGDFTALWEADGDILEFRAPAATAEEFEALLDTLAVVDVDTWLGAMPASVIDRAERPAVIAEMLDGIPVPDGFDSSVLDDAADIRERYQVGVQVVGAVSCAWIEQWNDARSSGDTATEQRAVDVMAASDDWPIVREMGEQGAYPQVLEMLVWGMVDGSGIFGGDGTVAPTVEDSYRDALGCSRWDGSPGGPTPTAVPMP